MGTYCMSFPFSTCEMRHGVAALNVADRQNTHNMAFAVRTVAALFGASTAAKYTHVRVVTRV